MALAITTTSLPKGFVGKGYSSTLAATGGATPYTWSFGFGTLPFGLLLAPNTGIISGAPITATNFTFTVQVEDATTATAQAILNITVEQYLLIGDIDLLMQGVASDAIGVPISGNEIRFDWVTGGQPAFPITEDVCFIRCVEEDDEYNRIREVRRVFNDPKTLTQSTSYTRVWRVHWTLYGPNSFDRARQLRSALFQQNPKALLAESNLYLIPDQESPRRVPEVFASQWWERVDFSARFNELVIEVTTVPTVGEVEVLTNTQVGQVADVTIRPGFDAGGIGVEGFGVEDYSQ